VVLPTPRLPSRQSAKVLTIWHCVEGLAAQKLSGLLTCAMIWIFASRATKLPPSPKGSGAMTATLSPRRIPFSFRALAACQYAGVGFLASPM
jgi:hypothetical protein